MSKQLDGIEQKDIIKRVTGKVTKLWEAKTFNGPKGEFTKQGGEIEIDGHGGLQMALPPAGERICAPDRRRINNIGMVTTPGRLPTAARVCPACSTQGPRGRPIAAGAV